MEFNVNSPILFVVVGIIVALVLGQSIYFLVKALKRAKELGMDKSVVKKTITSSATFTIAPAISILVGVITLSVSLGIPLPWLRLSVVGSLSYETVAAGNTLQALGLGMGSEITDASSFVTVAWVMTIGIVLGLFLVPLLTKKIQGGMIKLENKDKKWMEIFNNAMFLGMISAFLGFVFCDVTNLFRSDEWLAMQGVSRTACLIPVFVMLVSAVVMVVLGLLSKKTKQRWITDYALPISLILGMASAIPFTAWLG
jgi:hypothetical protein